MKPMAKIAIENGGFSTVSDRDYARLSKHVWWRCDKCGHIIRVIDGRTKYQACDVIGSDLRVAGACNPCPIPPAVTTEGKTMKNTDGADRTKKVEAAQKCDLCSDNSIPATLVVHGRCHMTAPLQATLEGNVLILRCYIPECRREVGRFIVQKISK